MHGLNRPVTRQLPPVAQRQPTFSVVHGIELVDEYAWLRADNWQEVMRDPRCSTRRSAPTSRPRTPTPRPRWPTPPRCRRRCMPR